jgi:hypothetical protein
MIKKFSILVSILLSITLIGCMNNPTKPPISINIDRETYDYEHYDFESVESMEQFYEQLDEEQISLEERIEELIEAETYSFEVKITNQFREDLIDNLPSELYDYNINWSEILGKYAIGTSVIIFTGVLHVATLNTPVAYIFTYSFYGALEEAFTGAVIGAIINTAIKGIASGDFSDSAVLKYALEGSADGFMWGAITGAILGAYSASKPTILDELKPLVQKGRYIKTNGSFKIDGNDVYYLGQKVGIVDDLGSVVGRGSYKNVSLEGQKLFTINGQNQIGQYNFRAIQQGFKFDINGIVQGVSYFDEAISVGNGASQIASAYNGGVLVGKVIRKTDSYGITRDFLIGTNGKLAAILNNGVPSTIDDWNSVINALANSGVNTAKNGIIQAIQSGNMTPSQMQTFVSLSDDARELYSYNSLWTYIKTNGKFPPELKMAGHHINNVANYPWLANDPNNIRFVDALQHRIEHNYNFQNTTIGLLTNLMNFIN